MRKKLKFYFNPHELKFVHYKPSTKIQVFKLLGLTASLALVAVLSYSVFVYKQKSPGEKQLIHQLKQYKHQVAMLNDKLSKVNASLAELQKRDNEIYRVIFEADPLPESVLNAGTGGVNKYEDLSAIPGTETLVYTHEQLDRISSKLSVMEQSYQQLHKLAKNKKQLLACMPAIHPVSGNKMIGSGFGMRIHPIYKTLKMHTGIDFVGHTGDPVYATGDGTVVQADYDGGYGLCVVISHGFGYQTLYGHLSKATVKRGQKVKRGEMIGKVGSTGTSSAPHLHYEVVKGGKKINPIDYFHNDLKPGEYATLVKIANQSNQSFD